MKKKRKEIFLNFFSFFMKQEKQRKLAESLVVMAISRLCGQPQSCVGSSSVVGSLLIVGGSTPRPVSTHIVHVSLPSPLGALP